LDELPPIPSPLEEPDVWTRRLAELVRLSVVAIPLLILALETIKKGFC
jgi:hypothetical protein